MVPALEGAAGAGPLDDARAADRRGDCVTEFCLLRFVRLPYKETRKLRPLLASNTMRARAFHKTNLS